MTMKTIDTSDEEREFGELTKDVVPQELESRIKGLNDVVVKAEKQRAKAKEKKGEKAEAKAKAIEKTPLDFVKMALGQTNSKGKRLLPGSYVMAEDEVDEFICTGHAGINYMASGKFFGSQAGVPRGKLIEDYGPSGSMKSAFLYMKAASVQRIGGIGAIVDAEGARNIPFLRLLGVDVDACVNLVPLDDKGYECYSIEHSFTIAKEFIEILRKGGFKGPIFVGIDSIAVCPLMDEWVQIRDGEDVSEDRGRRAKIVGQFQRCLNGFLRSSDNTMDIINQIRATMPKPGSFIKGPSETTTSGKSMEFYSDFRMDIRKRKAIVRGSFSSKPAAGKKAAGEKADADSWKGRKLGCFFSATAEKTRQTAPGKRIDGIEFFFDHGVAPLSGLFSLCVGDELIIPDSRSGYYRWADPASRRGVRLSPMEGIGSFSKRNFEEDGWIQDNIHLFEATSHDLEEMLSNSRYLDKSNMKLYRDPHTFSIELREAVRQKKAEVKDETDDVEDNNILGRKAKVDVMAEKSGGAFKRKVDEAPIISDDEVKGTTTFDFD